MSELKTKLEEIKRQKDTYILPENLKKDVTVYGVTGTLESGSGDVKLFDTIEHMQQDENPQEGDLAVVYREEIQAVTEESEFDSCIFPNTVVLDEAFSDNVYGRFRSTGSGFFDGMIDMSSSNFRFDGYGESSEIRIQYESQDGITYTRTDGGNELQEFGTTIQWDDGMGSFNSVVGNFMKIGGNYFEGIYNYELNKDYGNVTTYMMNNDVYSSSLDDLYWTKSNVMLNRQKVLDIIFKAENKSLIAPYIDLDSSQGYNLLLDDGIHIIDNNTVDVYMAVSPSEGIYTIRGVSLVNINGNRRCIQYICQSSTNASTVTITVIKIRVNMQNNIVSVTDMSNTYDDVYTYISSGTKYWHFVWEYDYRNIPIATVQYHSNLDGDKKYNIDGDWLSFAYVNGDNFTSDNQISPDILRLEYGNCYKNCSTQLDTTRDYVYEKIFYGKNGIETGALQAGVVYNDTIKNIYINIANVFTDTGLVIKDGIKLSNLSYTELPFKIDTSTMTDMYNMFHHCTNLTTIPLIDTSNATDMNGMFYSCNKLSSIPLLDTSNVTDMHVMFFSCNYLTTIPLLDTSNVTTMYGMFHHCTSLTTIPLIDTSSVTNMESMFNTCTSLTAIPLLNTSNVTNMYEMFRDCTSLTTIPQLNTSNVTNINSMLFNCTSLTTIPLIDTSNATNMSDMFHYCSSLTTIPLLNTGNVTNMYDTFNGCTSLTNDSLNNILAMCTNATKITSNKTLRYIGLTQTQATTCSTLSNYQAFTNAGWTTGY